MTTEKARLGLTAVIAVAVVAIAGMVYSQMPGEPTFDEKSGAISKTLDEARYWGRLAGTND